MKKVLLLSLGLVMGFSAFAQNKVVKAEKASFTASATKTVVGNEMTSSTANFAPQSSQSVVVSRYTNFEEAETMWTNYDLQSNAFVSNRMYQLDNGSVAVTATFSHETNQSASDRGTGYNFCANGDMGSWLEMPETRAEANATGNDLRTGWPTVAPYGANGEILVAHSAGLTFWTRETAGEGQWDGPHSIPNPTGLEGQALDFQLSWPRVATSGENNDIIHIIAAAQTPDATGTNVTAQFYIRSTDGGATWEVNWAPLFEENEHIDVYSADDYAISANGSTVAILYTGSLQGHVLIFKSTDDGQTWERRIVWENPYAGIDWNDPASVYTDTMYGPANGSVAVGYDGIVHVATSVYEYQHAEVGDTYIVYRGLSSDGIAYWNDTKEGPITALNGNPHDALRLWVGYGDDTMGHRVDDSIAFCGWIPENPDGTSWNSFDYNLLYGENDYFYAMYGASAYPSLAVDPQGNVAMAYSSPDLTRTNGAFYYRTVYVSYKDADSDKWNIASDNMFEDFIHLMDEGTAVNAVATPVNNNEFWFSCQSDDMLGFYWGNEASQANASTNIIYVFKVSSEYVGAEETMAKDVVYNVYPNPASEFICIQSSMDSNAVVTFSNLAGQTVKVVNMDLTTGDNSISITDLNSGVYFCTVKANGYSHTSKVVVK